MSVERIWFEADDGVSLEGEIRDPDGKALGSAVICHAHPLHGGSKDHPLLWAIRIELAARRGFVVLSFNFRGVMGSEGTHGGGVAETADVRAAVGRARQEAEGPVFVCGWSFGAHVALRTALEDDRIAGLALIGLPVGETSLSLPPLPSPEALRTLDHPVLLLAGASDPFSPASGLRPIAEHLPNATVEIVPGTDHYFGKREREAAAIVGEFAATRLS